jgi:hypothetical protein
VKLHPIVPICYYCGVVVLFLLENFEFTLHVNIISAVCNTVVLTIASASLHNA